MKKWSILILCCVGIHINFAQNSEAKVGIGTEDPKATLHVNGNLIIRDIEKAGINTANKNDFDMLFWNQKTGEIQTIEEDQPRFPFYVLEYELTSDGDINKFLRDDIDYDTKIKTDDYMLFIISSYARNRSDKTPEYFGIKGVLAGFYQESSFDDHFRLLENEVNNYNSLSNKSEMNERAARTLMSNEVIEVEEENGTWHLKLNYRDTRPPKRFNAAKEAPVFVWYIKVLAINKIYVEEKEKNFNK